MRTNYPCPYCRAFCEFRDSSIVYGQSYGKLLICSRYPACDAYVGCHANGQPKGTPANRLLRNLRKLAHEAFDPVWNGGRLKRKAAYLWLAKQLGIPREQCHIGLFDEGKCRHVIEVCRPEPARRGA